MDGFLQRQVSLIRILWWEAQLSEPKKFTYCTFVRSPVSLRSFLVLSFVWHMKKPLNMAARSYLVIVLYRWYVRPQFKSNSLSNVMHPITWSCISNTVLVKKISEFNIFSKQITLKRTWAKMPLWHKVKFLYSFLFQAVFLPSPEELNRMVSHCILFSFSAHVL